MEIQSTHTQQVLKFKNGEYLKQEDILAIEEPLEIQLEYGAADHRQKKSISITMRTPGQDQDLAVGFLFTEGIIQNQTQIQSIEKVKSWNPQSQNNIILIRLSPNVTIDLQKLERHFYTSSSCGVCGKSSIDAVHQSGAIAIKGKGLVFDADLLHHLPERVKEKQQVFDQTGGIHAAGLFTKEGQLLMIKEDVGRHNALDKLIGSALLENLTVLDQYLVFLSGRVSFELIQKSLMAGIPIVAAVGAPSTLAIELAQQSNMTVIGFLRNGGFNIYCGMDRIKRL